MSTTIGKYVSLIEANPDLSSELEKELILEAKGGNEESKEKLFSSYLKLVYSIANKYTVQNIEKVDLIGEGILGLEDALERFDPDRNFRFSAPAKWWVKARIMRYVRENIRGFSIPPDASSKILHVSQAIERLRREIGDNPTNKEVGDDLGFNESYVSFLRKFLMPSVSLDKTTDQDCEGNGNALQNLLQDDRNNAKETLIRNDSVSNVKKAIHFLSKPQRQVIEGRYGLNGEVKTLKEIGTELQITPERVRQIQRFAEKRLLDWMDR